MFSITTDRASLHLGGDWRTNQDSDAKLGAKWNEWLFSECVPQTWVQNLEFLQEQRLGGWDFWPVGSEEPWTERGTRVLGDVFERVVRNNLKLLPTVCGTTGAGKEVLFTIVDLDRYESAFREAKVAVVVPPQTSRFELARLNPQNLLPVLSPGTLRTHLALKRNLGSLSQASRMLLLHYVISDEKFEDIGLCQAPLVPIADGSYHSFSVGVGDRAGPVFLPRGDDEVRLFARHTRVVNVAMLLLETAEILQRKNEDLNTHTGISNWTLDAAAKYCEQHIFTSSKTDIITRKGPDQSEFVDQLWQWIRQRGASSDSISSSALGNMWLLPLADGEYRKLASTVPILDVSRNRGIGAFIWDIAKKYRIRCTLFTGEDVLPETARYLRHCGFLGDYEDDEALMRWFMANSVTFVDQLNDEEKGTLLRHLSGRAADSIGDKRVKAMKDAVASLKIFKMSGRFVLSQVFCISCTSCRLTM